MVKVVVFTSIMMDPMQSSSPIDLPGPFEQIPGFDYVMITNVPNPDKVFGNTGWKKIVVMEPPEGNIPKMGRYGIYANRFFKWHPEYVFGENYDVAIYVDGFQVPDPSMGAQWHAAAEDVMRDKALIQSPHPATRCTYNELDMIVISHKETRQKMDAVKIMIQSQGFPINVGLYWNGCYVYRLNTPEVQKMRADLWKDMLIYTYRDQALWMYELWKNNSLHQIAPLDLASMVIKVDSDANHMYV
jgi:hypothetical protein